LWYNGAMTTSDWITLGAAILVGGGTLFLGIMAWRTIRQTRSIQKAEKRERLLNEIIEWAANINSCGWRLEYPMSGEVTDEPHQLLRRVNIFSRFMIVGTKSEYVEKIASVFGGSLYSAVKDTKKKLDKFIKQQWESIKLKDREIKKISKNREDSEKALYKSADKVIKEAAKIKTRDIS